MLAQEIALLGYRYVEEMKARAAKHKPAAKWIVDKMLRNAWWVGGVGGWVGGWFWAIPGGSPAP